MKMVKFEVESKKLDGEIWGNLKESKILYFDPSAGRSDKVKNDMNVVYINPEQIADIQPFEICIKDDKFHTIGTVKGTQVTMTTAWRAYFIPLSIDEVIATINS